MASAVELNPTKLALIDYAHKLTSFGSFADMGGVWNVNAGYTFYALEKCDLEKAFLVDFRFVPEVLERAKEFPILTTIQGNFGSADMPSRLGKVDALFFFDTLLHQVNPDWDQMIEMYAANTSCFIIYNQQLVNHDRTLRLTDLALEQYLDYAPYKHLIRQDPRWKNWFKKLARYLGYARYKHFTEYDPERKSWLEKPFLTPYEIHPDHKCPVKDIYDYWQWGITDADLISKMKDLGFEMAYKVNDGPFLYLKTIENHGFIFVK